MTLAAGPVHRDVVHLRSPPDPQRQGADAVPLVVRVGEREAAHSAQELPEGDDQLASAEIGSEASVDTAAEREVPVPFAVENDLIGDLVAPGVTVSRPEDEHHPVAGPDLLTGDL